ncbi:hypothetical protein F7U66_11070 [Vibrio parahaemolyticus]|nr:hypothetical protein [Vibrio parahaemolyticus]
MCGVLRYRIARRRYSYLLWFRAQFHPLDRHKVCN